MRLYSLQLIAVISEPPPWMPPPPPGVMSVCWGVQRDPVARVWGYSCWAKRLEFSGHIPISSTVALFPTPLSRDWGQLLNKQASTCLVLPVLAPPPPPQSSKQAGSKRMGLHAEQSRPLVSPITFSSKGSGGIGFSPRLPEIRLAVVKPNRLHSPHLVS